MTQPFPLEKHIAPIRTRREVTALRAIALRAHTVATDALATIDAISPQKCEEQRATLTAQWFAKPNAKTATALVDHQARAAACAPTWSALYAYIPALRRQVLNSAEALAAFNAAFKAIDGGLESLAATIVAEDKRRAEENGVSVEEVASTAILQRISDARDNAFRASEVRGRDLPQAINSLLGVIGAGVA